MQDGYIDEDDANTKEDYLAPEERQESSDEDDLLGDEDLGNPSLDDDATPPIDEDVEDTRVGKFDDEEPDIDDVEDDKHPYPHP